MNRTNDQCWKEKKDTGEINAILFDFQGYNCAKRENTDQMGQ